MTRFASSGRTWKVLAFVLFAVVADVGPARGEHTEARFDRLITTSGVERAVATHILQDGRGFLWLCTAEGLIRYDGYEARRFLSEEDGQGLSNQEVRWMIEGRDGALWIATFGGLDRLDPVTEQFTQFRHAEADPSSIPDDRVQRVLEDSRGGIWVGTWENGLAVLDPATGKATRYQHDPANQASLADDRIRALFEDDTGALWVGTWGGGLDRFDPDTGIFEHHRLDPEVASSLGDDHVRAITQTRSGDLWVGTWEAGIARLDRDRGIFEHFSVGDSAGGGPSDAHVFDLFEDSVGNLWVGTFAGLDRFDPVSRTSRHFRADPLDPFSLASDFVASVYEDASGVIWIGTGGGVNKFLRLNEAINVIHSDPETTGALTSDKVFAVLEDSRGVLWVGTYGGGLNRLDPRTGLFRAYTYDAADPTGLSQNNVTSIMEDRAGRFWVATSGTGLNLMDRESETFQNFRHDPDDATSIAGDEIRDLALDDDGNLWTAVFESGVSRFDVETNTFESFNEERGLVDDHVVTVKWDSARSCLWIGTWGGGLDRFDPMTEAFQNFRFDPADGSSLGDDRVETLYIDRDGTLWAGTDGGGLNRFVDESRGFVRVGEGDGLASSSVFGIVQDESGLLWLSTSAGISRFDPVSKEILNLDASDGVYVGDFNEGAALRGASGRLYFGSNGGLYNFDPREIIANDRPPSIVLTAFRILGKDREVGRPLDQLDEIEVGYQDRVISLVFAALDFSNPSENRYAYRLEGWNDDWVDLGTNREVLLAGLPAGRYTLRVRAANNHGVWNEAGRSIRIRVVPPFWGTPLFVAGAMITLTLMILGGYKLRTRGIRDQNRRLQAEVRERVKAEIALRESEERFQKAFRSSPDAITITSIPEGVFLEVNDGFEKISGYGREEVVGRATPGMGIWLEGERERAFEVLSKEGQIRGFETGFVSKSGEIRVCQLSGEVAEFAEGRCLVSVIRDITELKEAETIREGLISELEAKNAELERFTYTASHDLKSPLITIKGFLGLLEKDARSGDIDRLNKDIEQISSATDKMKRLLDDLLELSRIGRVVNMPETLSLSELAREAAEMLGGTLKERNASLQIADDLPIVPVDRTRLVEVFQNLIENAVKFTPRPDRPIVEVGCRRDARQPVVFVRDNGMGIEQKYFEKVFGLFDRLSADREGTGIGLTLVKRIVELHGGRIWVESEGLGLGTTVCFTIPSGDRGGDAR